MSDIHRLQKLPVEMDLILLSFLMHFIWEFLQVPLYANMVGVEHMDGIVICTQAALGDVAIGLAAFWMTAIIAKTRCWVTTPRIKDITIFIMTGVVITVGLEFLHTEITGRWSYGVAMPIIPFLGTGLSPLAQWVLVPLAVLWYLVRLRHPRPATV